MDSTTLPVCKNQRIERPKLAQGYIAKIFGDRGYISETLKHKLWMQDIELITYHRKNMRRGSYHQRMSLSLDSAIKQNRDDL